MELVFFMYFFCVLIAIVTTLRAKKQFGFFFNHYFFYNFSWLVFVFLSLFCNSYLKQVDSVVYLIFLFGLLSFDFTILFVKRNDFIIYKSLIIDIRWRRLFEIIVIAGLLPAAYANFKLIQSGVELWQLNFEYWYEVRGGGSSLYQQYQQLFLAPVSVVLISTSFYMNYSHRSKYSLLINLLNSCVISVLYLLLSGGGRSQMMLLFYSIVLSFIATLNRRIKSSLFVPNKNIVLIIVMLSLFLIQWANEGRGKSDSFIQNAIDGQILFAPLFEYYLYDTDVFYNNTFGASMFEPIVLVLQFPLKFFDIAAYESNNSIVQNFVYLPSLGKELNAVVSSYFYYFRDFGWVGIFVGPVITACVFNYLCLFCYKNTFYMLFYSCYVLNICLSTEYKFDKFFMFVLIFLVLFCRICKEKNAVKILG